MKSGVDEKQNEKQETRKNMSKKLFKIFYMDNEQDLSIQL